MMGAVAATVPDPVNLVRSQRGHTFDKFLD